MKDSRSDAAIQFFPGKDEKVIPEIRLTRSKDGKTGQALFTFKEPDALLDEKFKEIKGMFLIDTEGELTTRDVNIRKSNGKYSAIEAKYSWKSDIDFNRFMRFANRYAEAYGLGYSES